MQDDSLLCLYFPWGARGERLPYMGYIGMSGSEGYGFEELWHDSDLEAFNHNPTDGSFAPLAGINCVQGRFLPHQHCQICCPSEVLMLR